LFCLQWQPVDDGQLLHGGAGPGRQRQNLLKMFLGTVKVAGLNGQRAFQQGTAAAGFAAFQETLRDVASKIGFAGSLQTVGQRLQPCDIQQARACRTGRSVA
jgi:hypothetical protein